MVNINEKKAKTIIIITTVLAFLLVFVLVFQFIRINNLKNLEANLTYSQSNLQKQIADFSADIDNMTSREKNLGEYAHKYLNWTKAGETWYTS